MLPMSSETILLVDDPCSFARYATIDFLDASFFYGGLAGFSYLTFWSPKLID